jgi:hypothetical protein
MTGPARDIQLSFLAGMDRPVGPVLQSVQYGSNAELLAAVAPIYLSGSVLDVTYGRGGWWKHYRPECFTAHDLELDGVDFTALPYPAGAFDAVCFDPPYVESGSRSTSSRPVFLERYGLGSDDRATPADVRGVALAGLAECCRVARCFVLVKCMEYVAWARFHDVPTSITNRAGALGWTLHDRIIHATGGGIGGGYRIRTVRRAQRAHSYLLVFAPDPRCRALTSAPGGDAR